METERPGGESSGDRGGLNEIIEDLLHDWIKYLEMRVNSIDWTAPSREVQRLLHQAIVHTRRFGTRSMGVDELWRSGQQRLLSLGDPRAHELALSLGEDVDALLMLTGWPGERLIDHLDEVQEILRRPGRRLRSSRNST